MNDKENPKTGNFNFNLLEDKDILNEEKEHNLELEENLKNYNNLPDNKKAEATIEDLAYLPNFLKKNDFIIVKNTISKRGENKYKLIKTDPIEKVILLSQAESSTALAEDIARYLYEDKGYNWFCLCDNAKNQEQALKYIRDYIHKNAIIIQDTCYNPTTYELFIEKNHQRHLNLFKWSELLINKPTYKEHPEAKCDFILKVINNLCDKDEEQFKYITSWLAYLYQRPAKKFQTALLFTGEKGSGKGTLARVLEYILGNTSLVVGSNDLNNRFKEHMFSGQKLLIVADEVFEDSKNKFANELKQYITDKKRSSEGKNKPTKEVESYEKWVFYSNNPAPFKIEQGDRRYAVFRSSENLRYVVDVDQIRAFNLESDEGEPSEVFKNEIIGFCCYLNSIILDPEVIEYPIMTQAKKDIIQAKQPKFRTEIIDIITRLGAGVIKRINRGNKHYWVDCETVREKYNTEHPKNTLNAIEFKNKLFLADLIHHHKTTGQSIIIPEDIGNAILNSTKITIEEHTEKPKEYNKCEIIDYFVSIGKIESGKYNEEDTIRILKKNLMITEAKEGVYKINNAVQQNE